MKLTKFLTDNRTMQAADGGGGPPSEGDPPEADTAPEAPDLSWLPEGFRSKDGAPNLDDFRAHYEDLASKDAQRQEALADVPEAPDGYEFAIGEVDYGDLDLPEDFEVNLAVDDPAFQPMFQELGNVLHKYQLPKGAASELTGLLAKYEATRFSQGLAAVRQEAEALGANAEARVSAVKRSLESQLPADLAKGLMGATTTAAGVKALEKLLAPRTMRTAPARQSGPDLEAMTPEQRLAWANSQEP